MYDIKVESYSLALSAYCEVKLRIWYISYIWTVIHIVFKLFQRTINYPYFDVLFTFMHYNFRLSQENLPLILSPMIWMTHRITSRSLGMMLFCCFCLIGIEGAFRGPLNYDDHPSRPTHKASVVLHSSQVILFFSIIYLTWILSCCHKGCTFLATA